MTDGARPSWTPSQPNQPTDSPANSSKLYPENYDAFHRTRFRPDSFQGEVALTQPDFDRFREFVLDSIGLDYSEDNRYLLGWGLAKVMEATDCRTLDQLYALLRTSSHTSAVWDHLVSTLTIGETYFFRNASQFDALAKQILPEIIAKHARTNRRIRIWSAGCATGEEPYSIAIMLHELLPDVDSWNVLILATDISREALRKAKQGVYAAWSFRGVERRIQESYFRAVDNKQFAISDRIRRMVTFEYLNLVADPYPSMQTNTNAMDLILCRNVTIYLKPATTRQVLSNFHACLVDGGWLIPGAAEPNMTSYNEFESRTFPGAVLYQKPAAPAAGAPRPLAVPLPAAAPAAPQAVLAPVAVARPAPARPDPYEAALELMRADQIDAALAQLLEKLDQNPDFVPALYTVGKIHANKGNLDEAQRWCETAIKKDKLHPEPYYTLSLVYQQNGRIDQAMDALKKAIYLDRNFVLAHYQLAELYAIQGDAASARRGLQNAKDLLQGKPREELVPEGDGLIAGRLLEIIVEELARNE